MSGGHLVNEAEHLCDLVLLVGHGHTLLHRQLALVAQDSNCTPSHNRRPWRAPATRRRPGGRQPRKRRRPRAEQLGADWQHSVQFTATGSANPRDLTELLSGLASAAIGLAANPPAKIAECAADDCVVLFPCTDPPPALAFRPLRQPDTCRSKLRPPPVDASGQVNRRSHTRRHQVSPAVNGHHQTHLRRPLLAAFRNLGSGTLRRQSCGDTETGRQGIPGSVPQTAFQSACTETNFGPRSGAWGCATSARLGLSSATPVYRPPSSPRTTALG